MDISSDAAFSPHVTQVAAHFGALLKVVRYRQDCKQIDVLVHLQGWTQTMYSRLESGEAAPAFKDLPALYTALLRAGILWTPLERSQFVTLARKRIEAKRSRQDHHSEHEWDTLHLTLARIGQPHGHTMASAEGPSLTILRETRHLVGRQNWLRSVIALFCEALPKKLVVLQGPAGVGKSSELHRLALRVLEREAPRRRVVLCDLPATEHDLDPESALDLFLATILAEVGAPGSVLPMASLSVRMRLALHTLEQSRRSVLLLLDNAEHLLNQRGMLAACWEQFLTQFLSSPHAATLLLATREWRGWAGRAGQLVAEMTVPLLNGEESVQVLRRLGLEGVPVEQVQALGDRVAGIPLCLEWLARLARDPLELDAWWDLADEEQNLSDQQSVESITRRIGHLLEEPDLVEGHLASHAGPLLQRLLDTHLSKGARQVLEQITVATIPLGGPALQRLCPRPALLKELRDASLLAASTNRVQVLPMVAAMLTAQRSSEQTRVLEEHLLEALTSWLDEGMMSTSEAGAIVAELGMVYLRHHRLLDAAQILTCYGWLSFNIGYGPRLAKFAIDIMKSFDWQTKEESECGGLLLHYLLSPFLGKIIDTEKRVADHRRLYEIIVAEKIEISPTVEIAITQDLMLYALNRSHFNEAQTLLDTCSRRLVSPLSAQLDLQVSLLEKQAWLFGVRSEHAQEQDTQIAKEYREKAISFYRQCNTLLSVEEIKNTLKNITINRRLARTLNHLGYYLNRSGQFEEALLFIEQSILLKEQGYVQAGSLAASYGEKAESLAYLGRFQDALHFDEKALKEVQRWANTGHVPSQQEVWIYHVNRGKLYLRIGKINEAERLLREALPHIHPRRRTYHMFAKEALEEIEQWRRQAPSPHHQLDWRWIERYRELSAYDGHWWLTAAGPLTEEEQQQWDRLASHSFDETTREQLGGILSQSRKRELAIALAEQRAPHFHYPALDIHEVRSRIAALLEFDAKIKRDEPNALIRKLYHEAIAQEEVYFLRLIEATYDGDTERFWKFNRLLNPLPSLEEVNYALSHVHQAIAQGFQRPETADLSRQLAQFLDEQLHLSAEIALLSAEKAQKEFQPSPVSPSTALSAGTVTARAARRFFETVLQESGYDGWQVVIDPNASTPRVEQGLRQLFLPETSLSVERIRHYLSHEIAGHVARCVAGEHSAIGLLSIHTRNSLPTEEGLALYHERQVAALHGQPFDDAGIWQGTLATGLAIGVATPPQTFLSLVTFFELFFLLRRLLRQPDEDRQRAREKARNTAIARCLRTYRGVPDLTKAGVCYVKDALYLHGLRMIERAVAQDESVLDQLSIGVVALETLPDLQVLNIPVPPQPVRSLAYNPNLDNYILSFNSAEEQSDNTHKTV